jgi:Transcriptional regulatory protein, C terminal/Bacterial transcriptional activator domain
MAEPPARVWFAVLGPVVVRTAGRVLAPGSAVRRALLGLLLLADGQPLPPDRLLRAVWGDEPPDTGRGAVHVAVSRLRSWLDRNLGGAAELAHEAGGYRLRAPAASLDAAAFRALVAASARAASPEAQIRRLCDALALWRGPVVADATAWLGTDVLVRRIEGLRVEAACALANAAVAARRRSRPSPDWRRRPATTRSTSVPPRAATGCTRWCACSPASAPAPTAWTRPVRTAGWSRPPPGCRAGRCRPGGAGSGRRCAGGPGRPRPGTTSGRRPG